jgi:hypothetical protein
MGVHQKGPGVSVIALLKRLGETLGYYPKTEEPMFPGDPGSPDLDITWRRNVHARFPLFIFEVESVILLPIKPRVPGTEYTVADRAGGQPCDAENGRPKPKP